MNKSFLLHTRNT